MSRASDQSFWGIGVPSLFDVFSVQPSDPTQNQERGRLGPWSLGWWWHTPEDTIDKLDAEMLLRDTRIYAATIWDLCTRARLPFDFSAAAREMQEVITRAAAMVPTEIGLTVLAERAADTARLIGLFNAASPELPAEAVNMTLQNLGDSLIPVNYTQAGPFDQDLALPATPVPGLASAAELSEVEDRSHGRDDQANSAAKQNRRCAPRSSQASKPIRPTVIRRISHTFID